jgi:hypothetical protein
MGALLVLAAACAAPGAGAAGGVTGTYRATVTAAALRAAGVRSQEASFDAGTWTLTLRGGRWTMRQQHGTLGNADAVGTFAVDGPRALFTLTRIDGAPHHEFAGSVQWRAAGSTLRFARSGVANIYELYVLVAQPWTRTA